MQSRRALPLILAVLMLATGCVTVRPTGPAGSPRLDPAASRTVPRQPASPAWPLTPLPEAATPTPPAPGPPAPVAAAAERAAPERAAPPRADDRPPRRAAPARPARPAKPARPAHRARDTAPAAKPRTPKAPKRRPARPAPRPAPQRTFDMAPLCAAARGRVDPAIVALCR
ncbi:hypothetical protein ABZZ17_24245 [Streptomyces sp. NPDC006512]|uniref:hypothetical protein n=1 Tax=Streptomyces sp. NPDC006512 TaxID=3154307 RepID=UPI0033B6CEDA